LRFGIQSIHNFGEAEYLLPEGETADGMTCDLILDDDTEVTVGLGSVFSACESQWEVIGLDEEAEAMTIKKREK
jgi:hypothetical protein